MRLRHLILSCLPVLCLAPPGIAADSVPAEALAAPGRVLILRHAQAPGFGDPPQFRLDDCSTQRNLDEAGRAQATTLGARLKAAGVTAARVYSSQWCRCLETARLLGLGPVEPLPALNSFYQRSEERAQRLADLRAFLSRLPTDGPPVVLVTHQVTISALAGRSTPSGGGSLFALDGSGTPTLLGSLAAE